jgi:hypothetical protein
MRGLFWNCRGIRKKGIVPYFRELVNKQKFDFICLQETMIQDFSDACLRSIDPQKKFLWDWVPAKGKSGGLLSGLSSDRFDVGSSVRGDGLLYNWMPLLIGEGLHL